VFGLQVFNDFDLTGDGIISGPELLALLQGPKGKRGWSELDGRVDDVIADMLPAVLRHADINGDGHLSFEEFVKLLQVGLVGGGQVQGGRGHKL
jgi:Ca2+-binding EF-hand superfamily protein